MVDSAGERRTISRRTVRPPTPESKTPIGRGSAIADSGPPGRGGDPAGVEDLPRDAHHVLGDGGVRAGEDERHTLVVRLDDEDAVGHDTMLGYPTERNVSAMATVLWMVVES